MRLFIAEKPSLGRAIADALGGRAVGRGRLSISLDGGDVVCWSAGHILELLNPDELDPAWKRWSRETLPIIPREWKLKPKAETRELLDNIGELLKRADTVVNAGDADREGQLLIDEILNYFEYKGPVMRLLVTDMNRSAIALAISGMRPNEEFRSLCSSAEARQRADWLLGLNMTRLFTVTTPREQGEILSVGRVQTPTLALIADRDEQIENFTPKIYYVVRAKSSVAAGEFLAAWKPTEETPGVDLELRVVDKAAIMALAAKLKGKKGAVTKFEKKKTKTEPPLPHTLAALQSEAAKKFDFTPADTLKLVQRLYEAKYVSYPRSDCAYLPESLYERRAAVLDVIVRFDAELAQYPLDAALKSPAWDTKKIEEHHGIVPTGTAPAGISADEAKIYGLVARRYAAQFLPQQEFANVSIEFTAEGELFRATNRQCSKEGWHQLYSKEADDEEKELETVIPDSSVGEPVELLGLKIEEKQTTPPKRFTEATLLEAMNHIHLYVDDKNIKKVLKENSGIGTAATQASIIETLKLRGYIIKEKKALISTKKGRALIAQVEDLLRKPDTTALWEMRLTEIKEGRASEAEFIADITEAVRRITKARIAAHPHSFSPRKKEPEGQECPKCHGHRLLLREGKNKKFWACSDCGLILTNERNKPQKTAVCPGCGAMALRVKNKDTTGFYWLCPKCRKRYEDNKGKLKA
ncbi:MAG: DNA topoisomerase 3 [Cloacibacillus sp.]